MKHLIESIRATLNPVQENKFVIPEEIPANEKNAFMGAAAAAHKAGKSHFSFAGKKHKVTMSGDTAKAIADDNIKEYSMSRNAMKRVLAPKPGNKTSEGMYKDMDAEKSEPSPRSDAKVKSDMKKRRKSEKTDVDMNPKLDKGTKDNSMEQKESRIRTALKSIIEGDRAKHYKGATKPETMDDKLKGKGAKDMVNQPKNVDDTEEKGHQDAVKAGKTGPQAKPRSGGDNINKGDKKIIPSATPVKGGKMAKTMEAYASMYEEKDGGSGPDHNYKYNVYGYTGERGDEGHHAMLAKAKKRNVKVSTGRKNPPGDSTAGKHLILRGNKKDVDHVIDNHIGRDE